MEQLQLHCQEVQFYRRNHEKASITITHHKVESVQFDLPFMILKTPLSL